MPQAKLIIRDTGLGAGNEFFTAQSTAFAASRPWWVSVLALVRPLHWTKNVLVFVPLLVSPDVNQPGLWLKAVAGFVAFSLIASAVYVLNDRIDVDSDRHHAKKQFRPFAAGFLAAHWALPIAASLAGFALAISRWLLPSGFTLLLLVYLAVTSCYSLRLKQIAFVDVLFLTAFHAARLVAGGLATAVPVDSLLITASLFFFASVAFAKRYAELTRSVASRDPDLRCRGYTIADQPLIECFGICCGAIAVVVYAGLLLTSHTQGLRDHWLVPWFVGALLTGWLFRIWWLARRRKLIDDPLLFAATDPTSLLITALIVILAGISLAPSTPA